MSLTSPSIKLSKITYMIRTIMVFLKYILQYLFYQKKYAEKYSNVVHMCVCVVWCVVYVFVLANHDIAPRFNSFYRVGLNRAG